MLLSSTVEVLLRVPTRSYHGLDRSIGEPQTGCPRLALLTAGIGTGSQRHTEIAVELVAARCTLTATYIGDSVFASAGLASTLIGTGSVGRAFASWSTAVLVDNRSFQGREGSLHLQKQGQTWKVESSWAALA